MTWYWLDTGWGCGAVGVDETGIIRDGAPIFKKLLGQALGNLPAKYKRQALGEKASRKLDEIYGE